MGEAPDRPSPDLLTLVQWMSPAFPVGGYAYSHGLETAVARAALHDAATFRAWLEAVTLRGAGRCDAVLLALAHRGAHPPEDLADIACALAPGAERHDEAVALGTAFARAADALHAPSSPQGAAWPFPVAVGVRARALDLPTRIVAALYLQAFAGNLATIAARIVPLGQTAAQAALSALGPAISDVAGEAASVGLDALESGVPTADLDSLVHETAEPRLFRS